MSRALIYYRVSTQEQKNSRLGLESQAKLNRELAARLGLEVVDEIRDEAVSAGIPLFERRGGRELMDRVALGEAEVVIALDQERLFRSVIDALSTIERWDELGARVLLVDGGWLSIEEPEEFLRVGINALFAETERRKIKKRTRRAMAAAKERGTKVGAPPFGLRATATVGPAGRKVNAGVFEADPEEARAIERVRDLARFLRKRSGKPHLSEIARRLNIEGIPTRGGGEWTHVQVGAVLRRIAA